MDDVTKKQKQTLKNFVVLEVFEAIISLLLGFSWAVIYSLVIGLPWTVRIALAEWSCPWIEGIFLVLFSLYLANDAGDYSWKIKTFIMARFLVMPLLMVSGFLLGSILMGTF